MGQFQRRRCDSRNHVGTCTTGKASRSFDQYRHAILTQSDCKVSESPPNTRSIPSFPGPATSLQTAHGHTAGADDPPVNPVSGTDLFGLGVFDSQLQFPYDLSFPFNVPSPGFGLPWPTEAALDVISEVARTPLANQADRPRSRGVVGIAKTANPYANSPFEYRFKRGPTINARRICEFLHDRASWQQVNLVSAGLKPNGALAVRIIGAFRDTIAARVHGMLYKLLDRNDFDCVPHLFPPLESIQSCFATYQKTFQPLYPIIHPATLSELSCDNEDPYADPGLYLTTGMALGCLVIPLEKVRSFAIELAYLIRMTITNDAAQDESRLTDKWVLSAWIMAMVFSAWSGVKRHMELAEAYKGVPTAVC